MTRTAEESQDALGDPGQVWGGVHVGGATSSGTGITVNTFCLCVLYFLCNFNDAVSDADKK